MQRLIECVPNISEGRRPEVIKAIADVVETVEGCRLLDVDAGKSTNRTVITFVGPPETVGEAAFRLIKKASELINMSEHSGEHPRMGATDVCPFVPVAGVTMADCIKVAQEVGERVGKELNIPGYFYESAAKRPERKNLAVCRKGQYEGLGKLSTDEGAPDFGPAEFNDPARRTGATAVGARDFLIAYNINLNTTRVAGPTPLRLTFVRQAESKSATASPAQPSSTNTANLFESPAPSNRSRASVGTSRNTASLSSR